MDASNPFKQYRLITRRPAGWVAELGPLNQIQFSDGDLACVKIADGKTRWQNNLRTDFGGKPGIWTYSESPVVDGDALICAPSLGGRPAMPSLQSARHPCPFENFRRFRAGFRCTVGEDLVDVTQIRHQFRPLFPRVGKIIPVVLEQRLL